MDHQDPHGALPRAFQPKCNSWFLTHPSSIFRVSKLPITLWETSGRRKASEATTTASSLVSSSQATRSSRCFAMRMWTACLGSIRKRAEPRTCGSHSSLGGSRNAWLRALFYRLMSSGCACRWNSTLLNSYISSNSSRPWISETRSFTKELSMHSERYTRTRGWEPSTRASRHWQWKSSPARAYSLWHTNIAYCASTKVSLKNEYNNNLSSSHQL